MTTATRLVPSDDPNAYARWVTRQRAYGLWQPFVDAQPARDHFANVMATSDVGWRLLADHAGVARSTVSYLLYGKNGRRATRITPENARRILALQASGARGVTLPSAGTRRRVQVLIGEGWPQIHLGPHFDTHPQYVNALLKVHRVTATTATAVASAYGRLLNVDPLTSGATAHGVEIAKRIASRNQWQDRTFWDDVDRIDDPDFDPATIGDAPKYMRLGEDALWLKEQGFTRAQIAERLGETVDYIDHSIKRYRVAITADTTTGDEESVAA